ncbi:hypothetical protein FBU30_000873, partial [Linnemannia zychae]
ATPEVTDGSNSSVTSPSETKPEAGHHDDDSEAKHEETDFLDTLSEIESLPDIEDDKDEDSTPPTESTDIPVALASESEHKESKDKKSEAEHKEFEDEKSQSEQPKSDPLDLIVDAALELARQSGPVDHDYVVLVN